MPKKNGKKPQSTTNTENVLSMDSLEEINIRDYKYIAGNGVYFDLKATYDENKKDTVYSFDMQFTEQTRKRRHFPSNKMTVEVPRDSIKYYKSIVLNDYYLVSAFNDDVTLHCTHGDGSTAELPVSEVESLFNKFRRAVQNGRFPGLEEVKPLEKKPLVAKNDIFMLHNIPSKFVLSDIVQSPSQDGVSNMCTIALPVNKSLSDDGLVRVRARVVCSDGYESNKTQDIQVQDSKYGLEVSYKKDNRFWVKRMHAKDLTELVDKVRHESHEDYNKLVQTFDAKKVFPLTNKYDETTWLRASAYENDFKIIKPNEAIKHRMYQEKPSIGEDELFIDLPTDTLASVYRENTDQNPREAIRLKLIRNLDDDENEPVVSRTQVYSLIVDPERFIGYKSETKQGYSYMKKAIVANKDESFILRNDFGDDFVAHAERLQGVIQYSNEVLREYEKRKTYANACVDKNDYNKVINAKRIIPGISSRLVERMPNSSSVAIHFPVPHDVSKNNVARLVTDEDHLVEYVSKGFQGEGAGERKYIYLADTTNIDFIDERDKLKSMSVDKFNDYIINYKALNEDSNGYFQGFAKAIESRFDIDNEYQG